jgi:hypothetical protein
MRDFVSTKPGETAPMGFGPMATEVTDREQLPHSRPFRTAVSNAGVGSYPVSDGDQFPRDKGYSEFNVDLGYKGNPRLKVEVSVYNLFNSTANAAAFFYTSRLPGEPAAGVTDFQVHPLEPSQRASR